MAESSIITHLCPNCGGPLLFNPKDQKFHCEYCLSTFTEQEVTDFEAKQKDAKQIDADFINSENEADEELNIGLFLCPSCGAEIVTDETTAATTCYYCHNPVVLSERLSGNFLPEKVLPFKIERKEAEAKFLEWTGKKKFIPTAFFNKKQIENLSGVYFPYWVVDAELDGNLSAEAKDIRVWIAGDTEYTETKTYAIEREGETTFSDLIKNALKKNEPEKMVAAVQPFDLSEAVDFKNQYLSGFLAEKRDIEFEQMRSQVNEQMESFSTALMEGTITGYDAVYNVRSNQNVKSLDNSYVLLPVWLVTYREKSSKKLFYYAMNGQTGKTAGILPISKKKLTWTTVSLFVGLLIFGILVGWLAS